MTYNAPPPQSGYGYGSGGTPPNNYLVPAILTTIFCCLPAGIVSIVFAAQVNGKWQAGDQAGAMDSSRKAKTWAWVSFGVGLAGILVWVLVAVVGGFSFSTGTTTN